ncbi:MAG: Gfo/Idh/MocA family oxidoreductase [Kiritimatiellae bacterium]|nr:Gfo/Idh/MocA family oxidoreductase [Kiritimatiellia bacterium]
MSKKMKIGIVGCGAISGIYFTNLSKTFGNTEVVACADLKPEMAAAKAKEFGVAKVCPVAELMADPAIELVLNLTVPKAHAEIALAACRAGKHVYGEKPLGISRDEGQAILKAAAKAGVRAGSAPDTFLGGGIQTCRKLIDDGWIGKPVAATAFMMCHGHESWHPSPEFYYERGGGPMLDMGPYYLTALVNLVGPVARVSGSVRTTFPTRTITSQPKFGKVVKVETPTHVAGVLDFAQGAVGTIVTSFDVWGHHMPCIEIYGTEGSLAVPDPNGFGGVVSVKRHDTKEWMNVPLSHGNAENSRGIGVADMAAAIAAKRPHRASGELAMHVLDVMLAFEEASLSGKAVTIAAQCGQPAPLPLGLRNGQID